MIHDLIQNIVAQLTVEDSNPAVAPHYIHGWKGQLNLELDEVENEIVWLLPVYSDSQIIGGYIKDDYSIVMGFFGKTQLDWTADQHLPMIERQRKQCAKFIYQLTQSEAFASASGFQIIDEYNAFDVGLSGVTLKFKATPLIPMPVC